MRQPCGFYDYWMLLFLSQPFQSASAHWLQLVQGTGMKAEAADNSKLGSNPDWGEPSGMLPQSAKKWD